MCVCRVKLSVKFATVFIVLMRIWRIAFGLVEDVGSFVLLAHAVDDEHDEEDGAQQTHDGSTDDGCKQSFEKHSRLEEADQKGRVAKTRVDIGHVFGHVVAEKERNPSMID